MNLTTKEITLVAIFPALMAATSWLTIPIGIGAPITLQTLFVMMAGLILGKKLGTISVFVYVMLGAIGIPVFAGMQGGIGVILGPTGGFIIAFILMAYLSGIMKNIKITLSFGVSHISSYALTVEPETALERFIEKGVIKNVDEDKAEAQFNILIDELTKANFIHYETSNFGKENFFSKNNSSYWLGKSYLGIGPSAHSFDGKRRSWNVQNNTKYIKSIAQNDLPIQRETLSVTDRYNEYVMTGLRTIWGVSFNKIDTDFGENYTKYLKMQSKKYIEQKLLYIENKVLKTTHKGKFLSDGIASDLFMINLI